MRSVTTGGPVSPGLKPRPSLRVEDEIVCHVMRDGLAGVETPAFVEGAVMLLIIRVIRGLAGVETPAFVEGEETARAESESKNVSPGLKPRPSLRGDCIRSVDQVP